MSTRVRALFTKLSRGELASLLRERGHVSLYYSSADELPPGVRMPLQTSSFFMIMDLFHALLVPRIERLSIAKWQRDIHGCFSMGMSHRMDSAGSAIERYADAYEATKKLLQRYEGTYPILFLELAVWKSCCIIKGPILHASPTSCLLWLTEGWKETKQEHFKCNEMEIILSLVIPFLTKDYEFHRISWSNRKRIHTETTNNHSARRPNRNIRKRRKRQQPRRRLKAPVYLNSSDDDSQQSFCFL